MSFINYNGKTLTATTPVLTANNRGFRYADGLFETLKFKNNEIILADEHLARLWNGMKMMEFDLPKLFTPDYIEDQILALISKNKSTSARVRLTVFRGNGGLYDPENLHPNFIIETMPLETHHGQLNSNGLQCCIYREAIKVIDSFSNLKSNQFLPYVMGALYARKNKFNDAILLNSNNSICDSTIANVFLIKGEAIQTPPLADGCVAGVMRAFVINELKKSGYHISEETIMIDQLLDADEVFLTNSIYNIRWVAGIAESQYQNSRTQQLFHLLQQTNPTVFC